MTFVTFIIAVVAIGAFYFYSTKPACREAVNNWSASACEALQEKITQSSGQVIKQKVNTRNMMQSFLCPAETPVEVLPSGSTVSTVSTGSRLITGISGDEKPEDETHTGRAETALTNTAREKGLVTGEKKKKKKKSKSKRSKKKKSFKRSRKEDKRLAARDEPDEP